MLRVKIEQDRKYAPVSLPYNYRPIAPIEQADTSKLQAVIDDSHSFLKALDAKHNQRIEAFQQWIAEKEAHKKAETMRLAPGYMDSLGTVLVPSRTEPKPDQKQDSQPHEQQTPEDELAGLKF